MQYGLIDGEQQYNYMDTPVVADAQPDGKTVVKTWSSASGGGSIVICESLSLVPFMVVGFKWGRQQAGQASDDEHSGSEASITEGRGAYVGRTWIQHYLR